MKTIKIISFIGGTFLASLACSVSAPSAPGNCPAPAGPGEQGGKHGNHDPLSKLNLTDAQKAQVKPIMEKAWTDMKAVRDVTTLNPEQKEQKTEAIRQNTDEQLKAILTPEQFQKLQANRPERKEGGKEGEHRPHIPFEKLNLSDEQKARVKPIMEKAREDMNAIHDDTTLSPEQKREKASAVKENVDEQLKSILTPEQYQKFQEMKAEHKGKRPEES